MKSRIPGGAPFWVYENWTHKKAVIHSESCSHFKTHGGRNTSNGKWHGPFDLLAVAELHAKNTGQANIHRCSFCL